MHIRSQRDPHFDSHGASGDRDTSADRHSAADTENSITPTSQYSFKKSASMSVDRRAIKEAVGMLRFLSSCCVGQTT